MVALEGAALGIEGEGEVLSGEGKRKAAIEGKERGDQHAGAMNGREGEKCEEQRLAAESNYSCMVIEMVSATA